MIELFGIKIPDYVLWILIAVAIVLIIVFILKGFFSEMKKNEF